MILGLHTNVSFDMLTLTERPTSKQVGDTSEDQTQPANQPAVFAHPDPPNEDGQGEKTTR